MAFLLWSGSLCEEERCGSGFSLGRLGILSRAEGQPRSDGVRQGWSALQRRIVASLIVEIEAGPFSGVLVESPGGLSVGEGR